MSIENSNEKSASLNEAIQSFSKDNNQLSVDVIEIPELIYASRFKRWLASVINVLVLYIALFIGALILNQIGSIICVLLYIGYQLILMRNSQQTLGKKLLKLQVLNYTTKQPLTFGRYLLREFLEYILALTGIVLVSAIIAFVNKERRSLADIVMTTIVVKKGNL